MKKLRFLVALFSFCLLLGIGINSVSASGISIYINGEKQSFSNDVVVENGTTLVPLRGIFEKLGADVVWNQHDQSIDATKGDTKIWLKLNSSNGIVNGSNVKLTVPAKAINGKTLVPLRFISEALGADVKWDQGTQSVIITESFKNEEKEVPTLKLGETFSDEQVQVSIKKVEYVQDGNNNGFNIYLSVTNKSEKPFETPGGLQFKLNDSKYENEVNSLGYIFNFESYGYIYQGETRDGYYQYLFDRDIDIKEIEFYIMESGILKQPKAKWIVESKNEQKSENKVVENKNDNKTYAIKQGASLSEVEDFLKLNYGSITTPMGRLDLSYELNHNNYSLRPEVYEVKILYGTYGQSFLYTIDKYQSEFNENIYRIELDEKDLNETISILKDFQREIYSVMKYIYPNKNLEGGFYYSWYKYPHIKEELLTATNYWWKNYREFGWDVYDVGFYFTSEWTAGDELEWIKSLK